ncbi:GDP-mannose transporter GONST1 [Abeliophyllum distichum]|uniref:GDP-mannose transporter GONST1 n=1 Tax=Abeliophyllum distichum TaxID=126358 RepID=A0ABD1SDB1_9LAMI
MIVIDHRSSYGMKAFNSNDEIDVESGKLEENRERPLRSKNVNTIHNQALLSGFAYCISSCSMILVNKFVLSSYDFNVGISLMLYQNFFAVIVVSILSFLGIITTEPLTWRLIKVWLPVNVIFVGMLITSMFSLKYINVAMVTVLKNVTNVMTAVGEMYLFNKHHDNRVWTALFLMPAAAGEASRRALRDEEVAAPIDVLPQAVVDDDGFVSRHSHMKYELRDTPGLGELLVWKIWYFTEEKNAKM